MRPRESIELAKQTRRRTQEEREMEKENSQRSWFWPEECLSDILSRTSAPDACRTAAISRGFKSAGESDTVWQNFLPPDLPDILSWSVSPPVAYSTKKELYFGLCNSPILLYDGRMSFALDKCSGKKCYMLPARQLLIVWGDTPAYWKWAASPESRFSEVAELVAVCWLDIRGRIPTRFLSPNSTYAAYLVFKLTEKSYGFKFSSETSVRILTENRDEYGSSTVYLSPPDSVSGQSADTRLPQEREDGWMEIEMGKVFIDHGDEDGEVQMQVVEAKHLNWKSGLIVQGFELRPKAGE